MTAGPQVEVLSWDSRGPDHMHFAPGTGHRRSGTEQPSIVHLWRDDSDRTGAEFTQWDDVDWAFCTPISSEATPGWAIYVAGRATADGTFDPRDPAQLQDD